MNSSFIAKTGIALACLCLLAVCGCASLVPRIPPPPDAIATIVLDGPYDAYIPEVYVKQLKTASLLADSAVPYLWIGVGGYFEVRGDEIRSIHFYERAIELSQKKSDVRGEAAAVAARVAALCRFGRFPEAYEAILSAQRTFSEEFFKPFSLYQYGLYYWYQGDARQAGLFFQQALNEALSRPRDDHLLILQRDARFYLEMVHLGQTVFSSWMRKMPVLRDSGILSAADLSARIAGFQEVRTLSDAILETVVGNWISAEATDIILIRVLNLLGFCHGLRGDHEASRADLDLGLADAVLADSPAAKLESAFLRAFLSLADQDRPEALQDAQAFYRLTASVPHSAYRIWAEVILSRHAAWQGNDRAAVSHLTSAVEQLDQAGSIYRDGYFKTTFVDPEALVNTLVEEASRVGDIQAAWVAAERAKTRMMVKQVLTINIAKTPAEEEILTRLRVSRREVLIANYRLSSVWKDDSFWSRANRDLHEAITSERQILSDIQEENEEMHSLLQVENVSVEEIRHLLDSNTTLFFFYLSDSALYTWVLNKGYFKIHKAARMRKDIVNVVASLRRAMARRDKKQTDLLSERVYEWCLKPVIGFVSGDHIGIVAHDVLHYLPFAAMTYKGASLIEGFSVFDLPVAGVLKYTLKKELPQGIKIGIVADREHPMPHASEEIRAIGRAAKQNKTTMMPAAEKEIIRCEARTFDVLHFALPAIIRQGNPFASGFKGGATQGVVLSIEDMFGLIFQGNGIVAGAVSSEEPLPVTGNEMALLGRAFLYAGAPAALKSLWRVDTRARVIFMEGLYRNMGKASSMAEALRETQNEMREIGYAPYDWAGYTLTGPH